MVVTPRGVRSGAAGKASRHSGGGQTPPAVRVLGSAARDDFVRGAGGDALAAHRLASAPGSGSAPPYDSSKPWLPNFRVRLFSVTVRTTLSGAPPGISAAISIVTVTRAPTRADAPRLGRTPLPGRRPGAGPNGRGTVPHDPRRHGSGGRLPRIPVRFGSPDRGEDPATCTISIHRIHRAEARARLPPYPYLSGRNGSG